MWIFVFCAIVFLVLAIVFTQPKTQEDDPLLVNGLESNGSVRVQTFEQMLDSGENAIYVEDQKVGEREVVIGLVLLTDPGFVVLYDNNEGLPGEVVGVSRWILDGAELFSVDVDTPLEEGAIYYAILYKDDGDQEFVHEKDSPVYDSEDSIVLMTFSATSSAEPETEVIVP